MEMQMASREPPLRPSLKEGEMSGTTDIVTILTVNSELLHIHYCDSC